MPEHKILSERLECSLRLEKRGKVPISGFLQLRRGNIRGNFYLRFSWDNNKNIIKNVTLSTGDFRRWVAKNHYNRYVDLACMPH
jgi:hypothetical protein